MKTEMTPATLLNNRKNTLLGALLFLFCLLYLFPAYIVLVNSFKNRAELYENVLAFPKTFSFQYYANAMRRMNFLQALFNSLAVTVVSLFFVVVLSSMCAWMLVRRNTRLSRFIFMVFVTTMLIPFQTLMMPLMQVMGGAKNALGLPMIDTLGALVYMNIGFGASMAVFLFHGFIKSVPLSLEEAATIDGCSCWGVFWRVVFPLLKPVTVTVMVLDVIWIWNDYLLPSLVLTSKANRTIPLSTASFFGEFTIQWNMAMAGLMLTIIPVILFYIFSQKYIIKGVAAGAVK
ncbi:MAG: carbohydrate ABC transporter permease [Spirochaetaceae bacterium]|jgi:raffinose/stachyose/melibiose transport system permease protein|nr:carbohydrate ABC transporter permease [Spirochaetaceae bacterium]